MKDSNPESRSSHLLSCPLSAECVRMLDSIDEQSSRLSQGASFANDDTQEHLRATQLAAHIKSCETCQVAITDARTLREQQRSALRDVMDEGETLVPATTASILLALRHEHQESQGFHESREHTFQPLSLLTPETPEDDQDAAQIAVPSIQRHSITMPDASDMSLQFALVKTRYRQHAKNKRRGLASIVVVAGSIAAIILFTLIGVFNHTGSTSTAGTTNSASSTHQSLPASSAGVAAPAHSGILIPSSAYTVTKEWSAVALVQRSPDGMSQMVVNYDPTTDKRTVLSILPLNASLDAISYQGDNMIFRQYDASAQSTSYYLLRGGTFVFNGKTSNAIWSADDSSIFVATPTGEVSRVDLSSGKSSVQHIMALNTPIDQLLMVRGSYLYFTYGNILYRASVQGDIAGPVQLMVSNADLASFWLDPYTNDLYYYRKGINGSFDLYTAPVDDSTNGRLLASSATLIGYGDSSHLIVIQYNQRDSRFEVSSIAKASGAPRLISDQIALGAQALCQNATAPTGAICGDSVALSPLPDNQALIIGARYGGAYRVQSFGLVSLVLNNVMLSGGEPVQLIGWDKLAVS